MAKQGLSKLPEGFVIDEPQGLSELPEGFAIDQPMFRTTPSVALLNDPNDIRAKDILEVADKAEVSLPIAEKGLDSLIKIKKRKDAISVGLGYMLEWPPDTLTVRERLNMPDAKTIPFNLGTTLFEIPKGLARFFQRGVGGTFGGTVYDWLGQFISEGGYAVDWISKVGDKDKDRIYNPLAESIIATGQNISQYGKWAREQWAYQAATGWEAMDADLRERDPIAYGAGRLSEGVASSALSVLAVYLSGGAAAPAVINTSFQINRGLLMLSTISAAGGFEHAQNQKENFYWATLHGFADGATEYAMETTFLQGVGKGTGKLAAGAKEGAEEFFTGMLQNTRAGVLENTAKGMSAYDASKKAMKDSLVQSPWEVASGFIGGFGIAGGSDLVQLIERSQQIRLPSTEQVQEEILQDYIKTLETAVKKGDIRKAKETIEAKPPPTEPIPTPEKPVAGRKVAEVVETPAKAKVELEGVKKANPELTRVAQKSKTVEEFINKMAKGKPETVSAEVLTKFYNRIKRLEQQIAPTAKPEAVKKKPVIPPLSKETKDILGGVEPLQTIHKALSEAKAVRPITEAAKKEALRKRVGAAAGALRENLRRGMPAEQAIQLSTGLLKGPLTEYDQLYESIEDRLDPEVKNSARLMITEHPDLRYFEILNTDKSFTKLIQGSSLTPNEAAQIERVFGKAFEEQLAKVTTKSDLYERLIATWKAGLLTGMKTSGLNILSTASHAVSETAKDVPAALIDSGISLVTGERKVAFTLKGYPTGWVKGLGKGWNYMKTGYDERNVLAKYDYKKTNFGTSKRAKAQQAYVEFIFHLLGAEDQPWYYGALSRSLYSQAIAQAKNKGLKGKERQTFVDNLQKNPTDEMLEWAKEDAETAIYTNRTHLGDVAKSIQRVKGGEVVVPFGRTPSAVAMQIINYSPIGIIKEISEQIHKGKFDQAKVSKAGGRVVLGTAALYLGVQLFKAGLIALGYPDNERERKLWELTGKKPNSVLIDGKWRGIEVLGPLGNLLVIGGYFQQALDSKGSPTEAMIEAMAGGAKSFTEQTFVRGVNLVVDALTDPEASFERWFTSMSGSLVPTIVADIARAQDDRARRAVGPKERIQSRIPIYRRGLPPRIDVFGQDLPRYGGNVLETMVDPTRPSKIRQDIVVDELRRLWDKDIKVSPTLLGDRAGYDILTKEENTQLWQRAGEFTYKALFGLVNTDNYGKANDFVKGQLVDFITGQAKSAAKAEIVNIKLKQGKTVLKLAESGLLSIDSLEALKYFQESIIETREEKGKGISR